MTTLDIDRLRAHYHAVDPARLPVLDDALRAMADHVLEDELAGTDLDGGVAASAWAVCVDQLVVDVDLDRLRYSGGVAASWARAILDAVAAAVGGTGVTASVVVYRREADALIDLVTAVAAGDLARLWAWKQVRLVDQTLDQPTPAGVADAAVARPMLMPAVLAVAGAACRALFAVNDWIRLAHAVSRHYGAPPRPAGQETPDGLAAAGSPRSPRTAPPPSTDSWLTVPDHVWTAVSDGPERWALAVLCQAVAHPHLTRQSTAIAAVHDAAPVPHRAPVERPLPADATTSGRGEAESAGRLEPGVPGPRRTDTDVTSAWGGVWFLIHALLELGVVDALGAGPVGPDDALDAVSAIVVAVTGAPADDPSVIGIAGRQGDGVGAWVPTPEQEPEIGRWATTITAWLAERANGRLAHRLTESAAGECSLWRRSVTIETSPGWIDIAAPMGNVDVDVRIAGLDLDPGFVWWLGAVVGFRYV